MSILTKQLASYLLLSGSHTDDDIEFNNPIFDKHTATLRSENEHDAMSDSMCIELDQSDSSEENLSLAGPQIVKQQWRPHTIPTSSEGDKPPSNTSISLDPAVLSNGIYQGLAITDADKLNQGMIPESVFMTARLEEQEQIEMSRFRVSSHVPLASPFQPTLAPLSPTREQSQGNSNCLVLLKFSLKNHTCLYKLTIMSLLIYTTHMYTHFTYLILLFLLDLV